MLLFNENFLLDPNGIPLHTILTTLNLKISRIKKKDYLNLSEQEQLSSLKIYLEILEKEFMQNVFKLTDSKSSELNYINKRDPIRASEIIKNQRNDKFKQWWTKEKYREISKNVTEKARFLEKLAEKTSKDEDKIEILEDINEIGKYLFSNWKKFEFEKSNSNFFSILLFTPKKNHLDPKLQNRRLNIKNKINNLKNEVEAKLKKSQPKPFLEILFCPNKNDKHERADYQKFQLILKLCNEIINKKIEPEFAIHRILAINFQAEKNIAIKNQWTIMINGMNTPLPPEKPQIRLQNSSSAPS